MNFNIIYYKLIFICSRRYYYGLILKKVKGKLHKGGERIANSPYSDKMDWWPEEIAFIDERKDDLQVTKRYRRIERQFREEVKIIGEALNELGYFSYGRNKAGSPSFLFDAINETSQTLAVWDIISKHIRCRDNVIYLIRRRELAGINPPIIKALPNYEYMKIVNHEKECNRIQMNGLIELLTGVVILAVVGAFFVIFS